MPPKKRLSQTSKHESTKSPTASTSHVSPDQHHLRHTGPTRTAPSKPLPASAQRATTSEDLPDDKHPPEKTQTTEVSPPGARTSFTRFMYILLFVVLLLLGWYVWGIVVLFERLKAEVGWWDIIAGDSGVARWEGWGGSGFGLGPEREGGVDSVEGSLEALANALGISPVQVASAVKPLVPQASLANIASKMEGKGGSEAVRVLFEDTTPRNRDHQTIPPGV